MTDEQHELTFADASAREVYEQHAQVFEVVQQVNRAFEGIDLSQEVVNALQRYLSGERWPLHFTFSTDSTERDYFVSQRDVADWYARHVAFNLMLDAQHQVPWRLADLDAPQLAELFDLGFFERYQDVFHVGMYVPSEPERMFAHAQELGLLGATHQDSILHAVDWARTNIRHVYGDETTQVLFGHAAPPTIMEVLKRDPSGVVVSDGCIGNALIFKDMLGSMGIPVVPKLETYDGQSGHTRVDLPSIGLSALHGDNLHSYRRSRGGAAVPVEAILVAIPDDRQNDLGPLEDGHYFDLVESYLPDIALQDRAGDVAEGRTPATARFLDPIPVVGGDRGKMILEKMDAKIREIGGGDVRRAWDILRARIIEP